MRFLRIFFTFAIVALVAATVGIALAIPIDTSNCINVVKWGVVCPNNDGVPIERLFETNNDQLDGIVTQTTDKAYLYTTAWKEGSMAIADGDRLLWRNETFPDSYMDTNDGDHAGPIGFG